MAATFDKDWESRAVPLDEEIIGRYERSGYAKPQRAAKKSVPLRNILGAGTTSRRAKEERRQLPPSFWRDHINGYVSKQTEAIITSTTDWDEKGYFWYSAGAHRFRRKDRVLMFDLTDDKVKMVEVVDSTRTAVRTPDGVHFVAFRLVRGEKARRLTPARWKGLKEALGVTRKGAARTRRKLSPERWSMARKVLHASR